MNNHALLTDLYEFSMANGYLTTLPDDRWAVFDVFFRTVPDDGSFVIAAGLAQVVDQLESLHFTTADLAYLQSLGLYQPDFLDYLAHFHFTGTVSAMPEGTPVCPRTAVDRLRPPDPVPADRNLAAQHLKPPVPDRHQGAADRSGSGGPSVPRVPTPLPMVPGPPRSGAVLAPLTSWPASSSIYRSPARWPTPGSSPLTTN